MAIKRRPLPLIGDVGDYGRGLGVGDRPNGHVTRVVYAHGPPGERISTVRTGRWRGQGTARPWASGRGAGLEPDRPRLHREGKMKLN